MNKLRVIHILNNIKVNENYTKFNLYKCIIYPLLHKKSKKNQKQKHQQ